MTLLSKSTNLWQQLTARLNAAGAFIPQIFLRLIIFWEFWEAGKIKYDNIQSGGADLQNTIDWFAELNFPFPFNQLSAAANYQVSMLAEILLALLILFGLFTRFAAISLIILTVVATAAVHWPENWNSLNELWQGYAISNKGYGNFKLPLLYIIMLFPLLFNGAGKFSLDHLMAKFSSFATNQSTSDLTMWALVFMVIGMPLLFLMPYLGSALCIVAIILILSKLFLKTKT